MCDSPQSLPFNKGPSNSAEWRGWFSGLVVRHLSSNQETRVRFPAEHIFTHFFVVSISVPIIHYYLIYVRNHCESPSEGNRLVIQRLMRQLVVIISLLILYTIYIYIYLQLYYIVVLYKYIIYIQLKVLSSQQRISPEGSQTDSQPKLEGQIYTQLSRNKH